MLLALVVVILLALSLVLIKATDQVVLAIHRLSKNSTSLTFTISAIFLAIATSLPELFVGITSALEGVPSLSLGNVIGANIANLSLVAGLAAFIVGKVNIHGSFVRKEVSFAAAAGFLPLLLVLDRNLSRLDGFILLAVYAIYAGSLFRERFLEVAEGHRRGSLFHKFYVILTHVEGSRRKEITRLLIGIVLLLVSASFVVRFASLFAEIAGIPVFIVGLILLSIGTTLPELAFSVRSLEDKEPTMFLGNLLGSIITNSTLILGIVAVITPIEAIVLNEYLVTVVAFIIIFGIFWFFTKTKLRLDRWEAGTLLLLYLVFVVAVIL